MVRFWDEKRVRIILMPKKVAVPSFLKKGQYSCLLKIKTEQDFYLIHTKQTK